MHRCGMRKRMHWLAMRNRLHWSVLRLQNRIHGAASSSYTRARRGLQNLQVSFGPSGANRKPNKHTNHTHRHSNCNTYGWADRCASCVSYSCAHSAPD